MLLRMYNNNNNISIILCYFIESHTPFIDLFTVFANLNGVFQLHRVAWPNCKTLFIGFISISRTFSVQCHNIHHVELMVCLNVSFDFVYVFTAFEMKLTIAFTQYTLSNGSYFHRAHLHQFRFSPIFSCFCLHPQQKWTRS